MQQINQQTSHTHLAPVDREPGGVANGPFDVAPPPTGGVVGGAVLARVVAVAVTGGAVVGAAVTGRVVPGEVVVGGAVAPTLMVGPLNTSSVK